MDSRIALALLEQKLTVLLREIVVNTVEEEDFAVLQLLAAPARARVGLAGIAPALQRVVIRYPDPGPIAAIFIGFHDFTAIQRIAAHSRLFRLPRGVDPALGFPQNVALRPRMSSVDARQRHRSEEHTSELQSPDHLVCRLLLEKKNHITYNHHL